MITKEMAARANCKSLAKDRASKQGQLEREILESNATADQKANMLHTMSKLLMFAADERDQLVRLGSRHHYYWRWLEFFDA